MSWFDPYGKEWAKLIETVSLDLGIDESMVEKDVIQSMLLHGVSLSGLPLVFKGLRHRRMLLDRLIHRRSLGVLYMKQMQG